MNEQPLLVTEWMTIGSLHRRACRCPDVCEKHAGLDLRGQRLQIGVIPGGPDILVDARDIAFAVPANSETIAVRRRRCIRCAQALVNQRMLRLEQDLVEKNGSA
jgi:hypothetical protein